MKAAFQSTNLQVSNSEGKGKAWEAGRAHAFVMHAFASIQLEKLVVLPILSVTLISSLFGEVIGCTSPSPPPPTKEASWQEIFPVNTESVNQKQRRRIGENSFILSKTRS